MRLASKGGVGFWEAQAFRWFRMRKRARQFFKYRPGCPKTVLLIVGCQRSGTSMLHHVLRRDPDTVTFDEVSDLSDPADPNLLRWKAPEVVAAEILRQRAPFVVAKPLVEAQELDPWFGALPTARAIWMFRGFQDVAASNLAFFGADNGTRDLAPILAGDETDWRFHNLDPRVVALIRERADAKMTGSDAAALFWYARNSLLFSTGLGEDPRVALCRYEDLVSNPRSVILDLYRFLDRPYPGHGILSEVSGRYRGRGRDLTLVQTVEDACRELEQRLLALPRLGRTAGPTALE